MALSDVEVRNAVREGLRFWLEGLETQPMAFERVPDGAVAPLLLSRTHRDAETGQSAYIGGFILVSDDREAMQGFLTTLQKSWGQP